ncbi:MAG: lipid-A-disaccharide synthase, partial [Verrucomicrobiota bacterium]|nr:lipid-A-disaccharide synthase [Verrucomicrobiota bacterium]
MSKRIYFVAGEASGDTHGAALMSALHSLDQTVEFIGRGGPRMRAIAGGDFTDWSEGSSVMGLVEVAKHYGYFRREFAATLAQIKHEQPDAVMLIDYPGFNLRLARALRQRGAKLKIIYYISPQVWAWNRRRIPQMARSLDLMLCIFPFESELYNQSGLRTVFVGHPMLETLAAKRTTEAREPDLIGLFPGSRMREIRKILPTMLLAMKGITESRPNLRCEISAASPALQREIDNSIRSSGVPASVATASAASLMQRAQVGMVASGTATLEAAFFGLPFVLVYRLAWLTYAAARVLVKVKHAGMPNVLAQRAIVPEFIQHKAQPEAIAAEVLRLLDDENHRGEMQTNFEEVIAKLGRGGAS